MATSKFRNLFKKKSGAARQVIDIPSDTDDQPDHSKPRNFFKESGAERQVTDIPQILDTDDHPDHEYLAKSELEMKQFQLINDELDNSLKELEEKALKAPTSDVARIQEIHRMSKIKDDIILWKGDGLGLGTEANDAPFRDKLIKLEKIIENASSMINDGKINDVVSSLKIVLKDSEMYTKLIESEHQDGHSQQLVNFLQWLLDTRELEQGIRNDLIIAARRVSRKCKVFPQSYLLEGIVEESRIEQEPPSGSFATVVKGHFRGHVLALKVLYAADYTAKEFWKEFPREAFVWGQLSHPNLLPIFGFHLYGYSRNPCFVSPWQHNGNLIQFLTINPNANRVRLALDMASGLVYLEKQNVVHGDLKGDNVLVDQNGTALLADFGHSSISDATIATIKDSSSVPMLKNTKWWAPELFKSESKKSYASDVYAWSMVCFHMYAGKAFLIDEKRENLIPSMITQGVRPKESHARRSGLTDDMWKLMVKAWADNPGQRPTAKKLVEDLAAFPGGEERSNASNAEALSPSYFRERMKDAFDVEYVDILLRRLKNLENRGDAAPLEDVLVGRLESLTVDEAPGEETAAREPLE